MDTDYNEPWHFFCLYFIKFIFILKFYKIKVQKIKIRYNTFQKRYAQNYNFKGFEHGIYWGQY